MNGLPKVSQTANQHRGPTRLSHPESKITFSESATQLSVKSLMSFSLLAAVVSSHSVSAWPQLTGCAWRHRIRSSSKRLMALFNSSDRAEIASQVTERCPDQTHRLMSRNISSASPCITTKRHRTLSVKSMNYSIAVGYVIRHRLVYFSP